MPVTALDREVERRLNERKIRYTRGRKRVVAVLAELDGPKSAADLNTIIGEDMPLSSLYRSLAVLEKVGVVIPHYSSGGIARYELAEWLAGHHHHLVCVECGAVEDFEIPQQQESKVRELVDDIAAVASFEPMSHVLEIEGRCRRCA